MEARLNSPAHSGPQADACRPSYAHLTPGGPAALTSALAHVPAWESLAAGSLCSSSIASVGSGAEDGLGGLLADLPIEQALCHFGCNSSHQHQQKGADAMHRAREHQQQHNHHHRLHEHQHLPSHQPHHHHNHLQHQHQQHQPHLAEARAPSSPLNSCSKGVSFAPAPLPAAGNGAGARGGAGAGTSFAGHHRRQPYHSSPQVFFDLWPAGKDDGSDEEGESGESCEEQQGPFAPWRNGKPLPDWGQRNQCGMAGHGFARAGTVGQMPELSQLGQLGHLGSGSSFRDLLGGPPVDHHRLAAACAVNPAFPAAQPLPGILGSWTDLLEGDGEEEEGGGKSGDPCDSLATPRAGTPAPGFGGLSGDGSTAGDMAAAGVGPKRQRSALRIARPEAVLCLNRPLLPVSAAGTAPSTPRGGTADMTSLSSAASVASPDSCLATAAGFTQRSSSCNLPAAVAAAASIRSAKPLRAPSQPCMASAPIGVPHAAASNLNPWRASSAAATAAAAAAANAAVGAAAAADADAAALGGSHIAAAADAAAHEMQPDDSLAISFCEPAMAQPKLQAQQKQQQAPQEPLHELLHSPHQARQATVAARMLAHACAAGLGEHRSALPAAHLAAVAEGCDSEGGTSSCNSLTASRDSLYTYRRIPTDQAMLPPSPVIGAAIRYSDSGNRAGLLLSRLSVTVGSGEDGCGEAEASVAAIAATACNRQPFMLRGGKPAPAGIAHASCLGSGGGSGDKGAHGNWSGIPFLLSPDLQEPRPASAATPQSNVAVPATDHDAQAVLQQQVQVQQKGKNSSSISKLEGGRAGHAAKADPGMLFDIAAAGLEPTLLAGGEGGLNELSGGCIYRTQPILSSDLSSGTLEPCCRQSLSQGALPVVYTPDPVLLLPTSPARAATATAPATGTATASGAAPLPSVAAAAAAAAAHVVLGGSKAPQGAPAGYSRVSTPCMARLSSDEVGGALTGVPGASSGRGTSSSGTVGTLMQKLRHMTRSLAATAHASKGGNANGTTPAPAAPLSGPRALCDKSYNSTQDASTRPSSTSTTTVDSSSTSNSTHSSATAVTASKAAVTAAVAAAHASAWYSQRVSVDIGEVAGLAARHGPTADAGADGACAGVSGAVSGAQGIHAAEADLSTWMRKATGSHSGRARDRD